MDPDGRAVNLLFRMSGFAAKACATVGEDVVGNNDGARQISGILRERVLLGAIDSIFQDMAKFMVCRRADPNTDAFSIEFDILRQKAEVRMIMGGGLSGEFALALCIQNASRTKNGETLVLASLGNTSAFQSVSA